MIVLVLTACPVGLRGHLTRWLYEISAGVFVGKLNPKLRDHVWGLVTEQARGRAILVYPDRAAEQGFSFKTHDHDWDPIDVEGITIMLRQTAAPKSKMRKGWSSASRYRRKR